MESNPRSCLHVVNKKEVCNLKYTEKQNKCEIVFIYLLACLLCFRLTLNTENWIWEMFLISLSVHQVLDAVSALSHFNYVFSICLILISVHELLFFIRIHFSSNDEMVLQWL